MGEPKTIKINDGYKGKTEYYHYKTYETHDEAIYYAKKKKQISKANGKRIKYFIIEITEGWVLPIPKHALYFNKKNIQ